MDIVVVDGPNLFNSTCNLLKGSTPELVKAYLQEWFDIDRFVYATIDSVYAPKLGVVIWHSLKAIGAGPLRFTSSETSKFWSRQGSNPDSSTMVVSIPGEQQETHPFFCKKCGTENNAPTTSEKGVDMSIATYLLDTSPSWGSACIFSRDVDFVPLVRSLRNRGKQVFCAYEPSDNATALRLSCQSQFPLPQGWLAKDFGLFTLLRKGGKLDELVGSMERSSTPIVGISLYVGSTERTIQINISGAPKDVLATVPKVESFLAHNGGFGLYRGRTDEDLANAHEESVALAFRAHLGEDSAHGRGIARHTLDSTIKPGWMALSSPPYKGSWY